MKNASIFTFAAFASILVIGCGAEAPKKGTKTVEEIKKMEEGSRKKQEGERTAQEPKSETKTEEKGKKDEKSK